MNNWPRIIQNWLYPPTCLLCGDAGKPGFDLCAACVGDLPRNDPACPRCALPLPAGSPVHIVCGRCQKRPPAFDRVQAPFLYREPLRYLIHRLKFHGQLSHARLLGSLLAEHLNNGDARPQRLIPVPLHIARYRARGFNQAIEIARMLGPRLGVPLDVQSCERARITRPQSELSARERRRNLRGAFRVARPLGVDHVAILDDVVTTGSTVNELAQVLRDAGVQRVDVWAIARAE